MSRLLYQLSYPAAQWDNDRPIEPLPGIGPGTSPLPRERSTNELKGRKATQAYKSGRRGMKSRSDAAPTRAGGRMEVD